MKTTYKQAPHFIPHGGKVVSLEEYRRRTILAQEDCLARQPESVYASAAPEAPEESRFCPVVLTMSRAERRRARRERRSWALDTCASLAVVLMTLVFLLRVML